MTTVTMIRLTRRIFPGSPDQVAHARHFVGRMLDACPVADDAVLLASELITNAIKHTASGDGGKFIVTVYRADERLRVEVRDDGSANTPATRPVLEAGESGYGLALVEQIASHWGHCGGRRAGSSGSPVLEWQ